MVSRSAHDTRLLPPYGSVTSQHVSQSFEHFVLLRMYNLPAWYQFQKPEEHRNHTPIDTGCTGAISRMRNCSSTLVAGAKPYSAHGARAIIACSSTFGNFFADIYQAWA